jgi:hypothetical protein
MDATRTIIRRILSEGSPQGRSAMGWITDENDWIGVKGGGGHAKAANDVLELGLSDEQLGDYGYEAKDEALKRGWIRVDRGAFEVINFNDRIKRRIAEFLEKVGLVSRTSVFIDSSQPKIRVHVDVEDILDRGITPEMIALKYRKFG